MPDKLRHKFSAICSLCQEDKLLPPIPNHKPRNKLIAWQGALAKGWTGTPQAPVCPECREEQEKEAKHEYSPR